MLAIEIWDMGILEISPIFLQKLLNLSLIPIFEAHFLVKKITVGLDFQAVFRTEHMMHILALSLKPIDRGLFSSF